MCFKTFAFFDFDLTSLLQEFKMDCSNPVNVNSKVTIGKMKERSQLVSRQDLGAVDRATRNSQRVEFPQLVKLVRSDVETRGLDTLVKKRGEKYLEVLNNSENVDLSNITVFEQVGEIPTCGILFDDVPIHPTNLNVKKGNVSCNLLFGPAPFPRETLSLVGDVLPVSEITDLLSDIKWYSRGTRQGMHTRLTMQMTRECKPSIDDYNRFLVLMDKTLDSNIEKLPDWNMDIYEAVETVRTSFVSSAGAPYWRAKSEVVEAMTDGVLPLIIEAYLHNERNDLLRQNPELFLCAVKNKDDRYEDPVAKTRPYVSLPWHFQALFSVLCQPFCASLQLFCDDPSGRNRNAYGYSFAHGGAEKLHKFATSTKEGEIRYCVYGDDVDLFYRFNGVLYQVCPDFKQMDGSVDHRTIEYTIDWIYNSFKRAHGESPFWKNICQEWKSMATNPFFIVEGEMVYRKKSSDGLMTGVVGTTLFDTVKSVLAYESLISHLKQRTKIGGAMKINDEDFVTKFFLDNHGLVIKEGTWNPTPYNEDPNHIGEITELKFLGQTITRYRLESQTVIAPSLPYREWMHLLLTPKNRKKERSRLASERYMFDRLRGLLTTGGALNDRFYRVCNYLLSTISNLAIGMAVQEGDGKGASILEGHALPEDFEFQNSSGWPTQEWVLNLYASEKDKLEELKDLPPIFLSKIETVPARERRAPRMLTVENVGPSPSKALCFVADERAEATVKDFDGLLNTADNLDELSFEYSKVSKQVNIKPGTGEKLDAKFVPTLEEQFTSLTRDAHLVLDKNTKEYVLSLKGAPPLYLKSLLNITNKQALDIETQYVLSLGRAIQEDELSEKTLLNISTVWYVGELASKMGQTNRTIIRIARSLGFFVYGPPNFQMISRGLVAPVNKRVLGTFETQAKENIQKLEEVKKEIKSTPISEGNVRVIETLKKKKESLVMAVKAQVEDPAILPVPDIFLDLPSRLKPVSGVEVGSLTEGGLDYIAQQSAAHKILKGNNLRYKKEKRGGETPLSVFTVDGIPVYETARAMTREVYLDFYNHIIRSYILQNREVPPFPEPQKRLKERSVDWVDAVVTEEAQKVRVYLERGAPLFVQLDKKHEIVPVNPDDPRWNFKNDKLTIKTSDKNWQPISGRKKTLENVTYRLSKLLSSEIKGATMSPEDLYSQYSYIRDLLNPEAIKHHLQSKAKEILNRAEENKKKQKEDAAQVAKEKGASRSEGGNAKRSSGAKAPKEETASSQAQDINARQRYQTRNANGGVRLHWDRSPPGNRQGWSGQRPNQLQSGRVGRDQGSGRSPTLATLQAEVSRLRNNLQRLQNDGGPVHGSVDRRFRRSNS